MKKNSLIKCIIFSTLSLGAAFPASACPQDREAARAIFKGLDKNGDGFIVREEYIDFSTQASQDMFNRTKACNEICLGKEFDKMDTKHNGKVDWEEFNRYYAAQTRGCSH